jgi:hypothetical protein
MPLDWEWTNDRGVWGAQATERWRGPRYKIVALPGGVWAGLFGVLASTNRA